MKIIFKEEYKNKEKKVLKYYQTIHNTNSNNKPKLKKLSKQNKNKIYETMDKLEKEKESLRKKLSKKKKVIVLDDYQF